MQFDWVEKKQGWIKDFLTGGSNLQREFDLFIVPDYLVF